MKNKTPDVKCFLNANQYLQAVYQARKNKKGFSYESWGQSLGLKSRSYLRFAVLGKRKINESLIHALCLDLKLDALEKEYFTYLVLYTQCKTQQQKEFYGKKLTSILRNPTFETLETSPNLLSDPLILALRNLLSLSDSPGSLSALAQLLEQDEKIVQEFLTRLEALNLASFKNGKWTAQHDSVKVARKHRDRDILNYHKLILEQAIRAMDLPPESRSYRSVSLALSEQEYGEYLKKLQQFVENLFTSFPSDTLQSRRLYQISFNLFPWTRSLETPLKTQSEAQA